MADGNNYLHIFDGRTRQCYQLPITRNTIRGADLAAIQSPIDNDAESMYNHRGLRVYDPGLENVAVMESSITFADGHSSSPTLEYRGYSFEEVGRACDFEDMTCLIIWGHKPSAGEKLALRRKLGQACVDVPQTVMDAIHALPRSTPFYPLLLTGLSAYLAARSDTIPAITGRNFYLGKPEHADDAIIHTLAAFAVILGIAHCHREGLDFRAADPDAPLLQNVFRFLHLDPSPTGAPLATTTTTTVQSMWVQGCDHEIANSTAALLLAASTVTDPVSCVMAALTASYGLRHFGAAQRTYPTLEAIGKPDNVAGFLASVKTKNNNNNNSSPDGAGTTHERIPGVGHRVYKGAKDPRVEPMKRLLVSLAAQGFKDPLLEVAYELERQVSADPYFRERNLHVNIDLYWPFGYTMIGIPSSLCLPMFLTSRMIGLMAHWREAMSQRLRMWRPQQIFTGQRAQTRARQVAEASLRTRETNDVCGPSEQNGAELQQQHGTKMQTGSQVECDDALDELGPKASRDKYPFGSKADARMTERRH